MGLTLEFCLLKIKHEGSIQPLRAPSSVGRRNAMRIDEGRKCKCCTLLAMSSEGARRGGEGGEEPSLGPLI